MMKKKIKYVIIRCKKYKIFKLFVFLVSLNKEIIFYSIN